MQDVETVIAELPSDERAIAKRLRALILDIDPRIREKLSYGVPYFFHHRRICFVWPTSCLPCGEYSLKKTGTKVTLGLCYGNLLSNDRGLLLQEGRKQVFVIKYTSVNEIDEKAVREILQEAVLVDDEFNKVKKKH